MEYNEGEPVRLDQVAALTPGFAFKSEDFGEYPDKVIKITDVSDNGHSSTLSGVNLASYDKGKLEKYRINEGDYYLAMTGSIGKVGRLAEGSALLNQRVLGIKATSMNKDYLWYVLNSKQFLHHLLTHIDSNSVQANISAKSVGSFRFILPNARTQAIVGFLLDICDKKIRLNIHINDYLAA